MNEYPLLLLFLVHLRLLLSQSVIREQITFSLIKWKVKTEM
jgi:hypothetical protein